MPRARRGRPKSIPSGRATPPAPTGPNSEDNVTSNGHPVQHMLSQGKLPRSSDPNDGHTDDPAQVAVPGNQSVQQQCNPQSSASKAVPARKGTTAPGSPNPKEVDAYPDRSGPMTTPTVDLQIRPEPGATTTPSHLDTTGLKAGNHPIQQAANPLAFPDVAPAAAQVVLVTRPPQSGQQAGPPNADYPTDPGRTILRAKGTQVQSPPPSTSRACHPSSVPQAVPYYTQGSNFSTSVDQPISSAQMDVHMGEPNTDTVRAPWEHHGSFAQLVDPNEGTELKFVPSNVINGVKCAQIEKTDVELEIQYWQSAVLCAVMGANPPIEVMKGFFKRIWASYSIDRILYVRKGVFLVHFEHIQDKIIVEKRGIFFFDSKPMLVKGWNPSMDIQTESIRSLPIWIQLHALDIKYWGMESLSKIGSILGIPLKTDRFTKEKQVIRYARLLVEMQIDGPFPEHIDFFNEEGILIRQPVTYEWIPTKCTHCAMLGHTEEVCKKKGTTRTEWRRVQNPKATNQPARSLHTEQQPRPNAATRPSEVTNPEDIEEPSQVEHSEPFITVAKGASPKRPNNSLTGPAAAASFSNRFNALIDDHILEMPAEEDLNPSPYGPHC